MIQYRVENVYLRQFSGDDALHIVATHLASYRWEPADRLRLALALGMQSEDRRALFGQTLELLRQVPKPEERDLVTAAVLALAEPVLTDEETEALEKELKDVSKILERAEQRGHAQGMKRGLEQGLEQGRDQAMQRVARAMLADGDPVAKIMRVTGLSPEAIDALRTH